VVTQCKGVTIKSNDLQGSTNGIAIDTGEYCVISDNMLVADAFDAINLNTFKSVKISNNIIVSSRLGVQINGGSYDVIIDGNVFKTLTNHGIAFNDAAGNSVVSNNRFTFMPTGNRVVNFSATAGKVGINANMYPSSVTTFQNGTGSQALLGTNYPI
jgi:Nitrous oxidase accessory protein